VGAVPMLAVAGPLFWGTVQTFPGYFRHEYSGGYNGFTSEPLRLLADYGVKKGLVFLAESPRWQHLVTAIVANDMSFAGDLIFARHLDDRDQVLIAAHPNHPPYLITWNGRALELARLQIDAESREPVLRPMPADPDDPLVIGESNIFRGVQLRLGAGLVGGLATDSDGNLYAVDSADHEVLVFDAAGILRRRLRVSYGFGPGAIPAGQGIAVDSERNVYVANLKPPGVVRFNADGTFGWRAHQTRNGDERLTEPIGIAVLPDGNLVVTNADPPDLHVLRRDGSFAGLYARGAARAELRRPVAVAVGTNRHLYVSDAQRKALLEIDEGGRAVRHWPLPVDPARPFGVSYVAVDRRGHAYVSDFNALALYHVRPDKPGAEVVGPSETVGEPNGITTRDGELLVLKSSFNKILRMPLP
jgi:sugar lactone lactonase YvrE